MAQLVNIKDILAKVQIPPKLKPVYDKLVFNGKRLMFAEDMEDQMNKLLDGEGELPAKIAKGTVAVMYMMWTQSNKTLPPELMVPVTFTLTLHAFDFLQQSNEPGLTVQVLGDAVEESIRLIMQGFGISEDEIQQYAEQNKGSLDAAGVDEPVGGANTDASPEPRGEAPPAETPPDETDPPINPPKKLETGMMAAPAEEDDEDV